MFGGAVFDLILNVFRVVSISSIVRSDWHEHQLSAGVMPLARVIGSVTDHIGRLNDSRRVTRLVVCSGAWLLSEFGYNWDL